MRSTFICLFLTISQLLCIYHYQESRWVQKLCQTWTQCWSSVTSTKGGWMFSSGTSSRGNIVGSSFCSFLQRKQRKASKSNSFFQYCRKVGRYMQYNTRHTTFIEEFTADRKYAMYRNRRAWVAEFSSRNTDTLPAKQYVRTVHICGIQRELSTNRQ